MFWICCPIILLCLLGFCRKESFWSILILPFCLFFATFFALGYYQPLANILDGIIPSIAFYNDLIAFTLIYAIVFAINVFVTHFLSRVSLFFPEKVNLIGNLSIVSVIFLVFYFGIATLFFYMIPEGPPRASFDNLAPMPQFSIYETLSRGSLKPIGGTPDDLFDFTKYYKAEVGKNAQVYMQVLPTSGSENEWKLNTPNKKSPNVAEKPKK